MPVVRGQPRQAEVEDLQTAVVSEEEVLRLQVAVDDAARVGGGESVGQLDRQALHLRGRKARPVDHGAERVSLEQLGDQEGHAVLLSQIVHGEDIRVLERTSGPRLLLEALHPSGVVRGGHHLHRHAPAELFVASDQHPSHAALAQLALDAVAAGEHRSRRQLLRDRRGLGSGDRGLPRRRRRRGAIGGSLGADESPAGQIVEPGDEAGRDEPKHRHPDQRANRPPGEPEILHHDVGELQGAGGRDAIGGQRAQDAAPPQLAEDAAHFTWWAMTLSLIFA